MNTQEAINFLEHRAKKETGEVHQGFKDAILLIKQQQNTIVNLRLADKEEIQALKAENAELKTKAKELKEMIDELWRSYKDFMADLKKF